MRPHIWGPTGRMSTRMMGLAEGADRRWLASRVNSREIFFLSSVILSPAQQKSRELNSDDDDGPSAPIVGPSSRSCDPWRGNAAPWMAVGSAGRSRRTRPLGRCGGNVGRWRRGWFPWAGRVPAVAPGNNPRKRKRPPFGGRFTTPVGGLRGRRRWFRPRPWPQRRPRAFAPLPPGSPRKRP